MAATTTPPPEVSAPPAGARAYDAFVSYSHAADGRLAPALQTGLQSLAKPWYRRRALRIFRDETSLSVSPELWPSIEAALSQARYFILMASPEAADSPWVDQEVRWWRAHRSHQTVLIALTDGELDWDDERQDFSAGGPVPPGLRGWFPREPLWVDLRWARNAQDVSMRNPRFRDSVGEIAAPLHGVPKDELIGEDISQHRRTIRLARAAVALLVLLLVTAVVGGVIALIQRNNARNQSDLAIAGQVAATGVANLEDRLDVAQLLAAEGHTRRETAQTAAALFRAVTASPHLARFADNRTPVTALVPAVGQEGVFVGGRDGTVRSWSVGRDKVGPPLVDLARPITVAQTSENGRYLAAGDEAGSVSVVDLRDRSVARVALHGRVAALAVTDDGRWLAAVSDDDSPRLSLHDLPEGQVETEVGLGITPWVLAFDDIGITLMVGGFDGSVERRLLPTLGPLGEPTGSRTPAGNYTAAYSPNERFFGFYKFGVWVWHTGANRGKLVFPITSTGEASTVAIAPDASLTAVATERAISVVEPRRRGRGPYSIGAQPGGLVTEPMTGISGRTDLLVFLDSGRRLVSASGSLLALWDLDSDGRIARPLPIELPDTSTASVPPGLSVAGQAVAWTSEKPEVGVWDPERGHRVLPIPDGFVNYGTTALSTGGRYLAAAGTDGVHVWDLSRSTGPLRVPSSGGLVNRIEVLEQETSSDSLIAVWDNGRVDRLALDSNRLRRVAPSPGESSYLTDVAVAPEADLAAVVVDGRLSMVDLATGRRSDGPKLGFPVVLAVALSGDGGLLAAADNRDSVVLWDVRDRLPVRRLVAGRVISIVFDQEAKRMATLNGEGLLAVWEVSSGTKLGEVQLPERGETVSPDRGVETTMRFSSDGDLWTATAGGRLIRWSMSPDAWARSVCETVNRSLTQSEWERYIGTGGSPEFSCPPG